MGAMRKFGGWGNDQVLHAQAALHDAALDLGVAGIAVFNDTHTHAEVLGLFDKAVTALERKSNDT